MALADLQTALGSLVVARASGPHLTKDAWKALFGLNLTVQEHAWLEDLAGSPGFEVTCYIQRWWRLTRLRWAAWLTLGVLGPVRSTSILDAYLNNVPPSSLFFIPEALGLLDFILRSSLAVPHLEAVARFERALLMTTQAMSCPDPDPESQETLVEFAAPPEMVLEALVQGQSLPDPDGQHYLVRISPAEEQGWRVLGAEEAEGYSPLLPSAVGA